MAKRNLNLYNIVPAYIRQKDENKHTREYLDAADNLLDNLHQTVQQFYADNFPDKPLEPNNGNGELASQAWLLPYFADLLDVQTVSPLVQGKRAEISNAVRWRQHKGTTTVVDEVAEGIGQWEAVVQEAWQRLAMTPRLNEPLLPESYFGFSTTLNNAIPQEMAKHPGTAAATPDFRTGNFALPDENNSPISQVSEVNGEAYRWRPHYPHGIPCEHQRIDLDGQFVGAAFDDISKRTPDLRNSDWHNGHYHPRKILLYIAQPEGFFKYDAPTVQWQQTWLDDDTLPSDAFLQHVTLYSDLDGALVFESRYYRDEEFKPVHIRGVFKLGQVPSGVGSPDDGTYIFQGLTLINRVEVDSGIVYLDRCAASHLDVHSTYDDTDPRNLKAPVINATNCLFKELKAATSLVRLEYCTVLNKCICEALQASDCIFNCLIKKDVPNKKHPASMCVRYSKVVTKQLPTQLESKFHNTRQPVVFFETKFGESSCAVLHPATDDSVKYGAEDKTEMGAYHFLALSIRYKAIIQKLKDYLPVAYEAVVIPDKHLRQLPERFAEIESGS